MTNTGRWVGFLAVTCLAGASCNTDRGPTASRTTSPLRFSGLSAQGSQIHIMPLPGFGPQVATPAGGLGQGDIFYHGGPIIYQPQVAAIYWGLNRIYNGGPAPGTSGTGAADGSLVGFFLGALGGSHYFRINTGYYDGTGTHVQNSITYSQYWADNTDPGSSPSDGDIQNEVIKGFSSGELTYDPNTLYHVFTGPGVNLGGSFLTVYCAYHGHFTWNGNDVKYSAMPYVGGTVCSELNGSPNNDPAADAVVNVLAHETEETTTDEDINAWLDSAQFENADKCNFMFGPTYTTSNGATANMKVGGRDFLVQENWLNVTPQKCALGFIKVSITGPHTIPVGVVCTWTGSGSRGTAPYTYQWTATQPLTGWSPQNGTFNGLSEGAEGTAMLSVTATDATGDTAQTTDTIRVTRMTNVCEP